MENNLVILFSIEPNMTLKMSKLATGNEACYLRQSWNSNCIVNNIEK